MRVLIVEDDPLIALSLEMVLSDAGHVVIGPASSVERALTCAKSEKPDFALVDIRLRNGGNGIGLARLLRDLNIPSIFVSGQRAEAEANRDAALGLLGKPFSPEAALATVAVAEVLLAGKMPPPPPVPAELQLFVA